MLEKVLRTELVSAIELNLACPNIPGKPVIAYDFEQMDTVLKAVTGIANFSKKPMGIKLAPYLDQSHVDRAISILSKYPIKYIVTSNTIGNCLLVDAENECASIASKGGLGGLGGGYIKPIALANVRMIAQKLIEYNRTDIDIVGVGGVSTGKDAFELILCGAKAVQVGTCHWTEGPACFDRIASELEAIMRKKGYTSIDQFCGKLKDYTKPSKKTSTTTTTTVASSTRPTATTTKGAKQGDEDDDENLPQQTLETTFISLFPATPKQLPSNAGIKAYSMYFSIAVAAAVLYYAYVLVNSLTD